MRKQRINCFSCETKTDIVVWESNKPEDEVELNYCPVCSAGIDDYDSYLEEE